MHTLMRLAAGILVLGVLALTTIVLDPTYSLLFSFQRYSAKSASMVDVIGRKEQLDQRQDALLDLREAKEQVAAEVIAQRRTLAEAIERFRTVD